MGLKKNRRRWFVRHEETSALQVALANQLNTERLQTHISNKTFDNKVSQKTQIEEHCI